MQTQSSLFTPSILSGKSKGFSIMLVAAFLFAILGVLIKILGPSYRVWDIAVYRFVGGILFTSILAQILMNHGFRYCKSWEGGLFMTTEVVFAAMFGVIFLGEVVFWRLGIGGLMIFSSAVAFSLQNRLTVNQDSEP